ncbi:Splicing factor PWI [Penicillium bovifimosum]|uniref:Splicing factor PWI n=1 Tax=Penicillium bovifimosum TaxID=126998 RepID=A0A9W9GMJ3_9EURO|nr:Splicing factor PWI [Penicillium bovifimosum]KAJ5124400.1 Splicing factor PWI [Penicillium bovifimosum]
MASSVDAKLLKRTKFPPEFNKKVDMTKVNVEVLKTWIASQIIKILGNEDDVVIELCFAHLENERFPDIKSLQIQLTGFLDKDTPKFCEKLWSLCLSGQENPQGVPKELLEAKKLELMREKLEAEKAAEAARRQRELDQNQLVIVGPAEADPLEDETTIVLRLLASETAAETAAETASASVPPAVNMIHMCRLERTATADHPLSPTPVPHPRSHHLHPAELATSHATGRANAAAVLPVTQFLPSDATVEDTEDAVVRTTVTVLKPDPFPAPVPRAHVPPEETAAVEAPSRAAALHLRHATPTAAEMFPLPFLPAALVPRRAPAAPLDDVVVILAA